MRKTNPWIIVIFLLAFLASFEGCVTEKATLKIERSLTQNEFAYYNDSFDKLREELWEKAGYVHSKVQMANFKLAYVSIENGRVRVETKTGCFSKGGLASKYALRGDFDIQVDCHIDFLKGRYDMDQYLAFKVISKAREIQETESVVIGLIKKGELNFSTIFSGYIEKGKYHHGNGRKIGNFHGTLRIRRIGNRISTLYKKEGKSEWKKINTFRFSANDIIFGFALTNYVSKRNTIKARSPITATFDNFRINDAQEIIESEI